jgi:two-component system chemotaxis sensor kinase CheA
VLAHKLEELFDLAAQPDHRISEELELVVTMAIQFLGMMLRKKSSNAMTGIDLDGFVRQVDEVLREARTVPIMPRTSTITRPVRAEASTDRLSEATRHRLAIAGTSAFLEYLSARGGTSRSRLRGVWNTVRDELSNMQSLPLASVLEPHTVATQALLQRLGKRAELVIDAGEVRVDARISEAIGLAAVHLITNAVDHGIELPAARVAAGKRPQGAVRLRAAEHPGWLVVTIDDDGAGVDVEAVRARAIERGLLSAARAEGSSESELLEYILQPGFSTRDAVNDVSGRGVGLDAVKTAVTRVGGSLRIASTRTRGTSFTLSIPVPQRQVRAYHFLAPGGAVALGFSARWTPSIEDAPAADALDPVRAIQLAGTSRQTATERSRPLKDLVLRLRWGFLEIVLRAASEPVLVTAERICPTPDDYPIEVVTIDNHETILLRPEHLSLLPRADHA